MVFFLGQIYPVDIGVLIGSSRSTTKASWKNTLNFVSNLVSDFNISPQGAHIGVITFHETPRVAFSFNTLQGLRQNGYEVQRLIKVLPFRQGYTRIDRALQLANSYLFTKKAGSRQGAAKVIQIPLQFVWHGKSLNYHHHHQPHHHEHHHHQHHHQNEQHHHQHHPKEHHHYHKDHHHQHEQYHHHQFFLQSLMHLFYNTVQWLILVYWKPEWLAAKIDFGLLSARLFLNLNAKTK